MSSAYINSHILNLKHLCFDSYILYIEIGMLHSGLLIKMSKLYCNRTGILYCRVLQGWLLEHQIGNLESATARPIVATTATSLQSFSTWNNWYWIEQFGYFPPQIQNILLGCVGPQERDKDLSLNIDSNRKCRFEKNPFKWKNFF